MPIAHRCNTPAFRPEMKAGKEYVAETLAFRLRRGFISRRLPKNDPPQNPEK